MIIHWCSPRRKLIKLEGGEQPGVDWAEHSSRVSAWETRPIEVSGEPDEQNLSEQTKEAKGRVGVRKTGVQAEQVGGQRVEQDLEYGENNDRQEIVDANLGEIQGEQSKSEHPTRNREQRDEKKQRFCDDSAEQPVNYKVSR